MNYKNKITFLEKVEIVLTNYKLKINLIKCTIGMILCVFKQNRYKFSQYM